MFELLDSVLKKAKGGLLETHANAHFQNIYSRRHASWFSNKPQTTTTPVETPFLNNFAKLFIWADILLVDIIQTLFIDFFFNLPGQYQVQDSDIWSSVTSILFFLDIGIRYVQCYLIRFPTASFSDMKTVIQKKENSSLLL